VDYPPRQSLYADSCRGRHLRTVIRVEPSCPAIRATPDPGSVRAPARSVPLRQPRQLALRPAGKLSTVIIGQHQPRGSLRHTGRLST
jgi:hypothetical protein